MDELGRLECEFAPDTGIGGTPYVVGDKRPATVGANPVGELPVVVSCRCGEPAVMEAGACAGASSRDLRST